MDTSRFANFHRCRSELSQQAQIASYLLQRLASLSGDQQEGKLAGIEATLSTLACYPGFAEAATNLLSGKSWDEYLEHWWTLTVARHLAQKGLLREMEVYLPNGRKPDIRAEVHLQGVQAALYVEAKSWRFHPSLEISSSGPNIPLDKRVERMKAKLLKQLPEDNLGVWAWDKMRDVISGTFTLGSADPELGPKEKQAIKEVCAAVPEIAAVMVKTLDSWGKETCLAVPNPSSKWLPSTVQL